MMLRQANSKKFCPLPGAGGASPEVLQVDGSDVPRRGETRVGNLGEKKVWLNFYQHKTSSNWKN